MKLTIVGSTGSMSGPGAAASCYLVQARGFDPEIGAERTWSVAMDMGPGSFGELTRYIDPRELDAVLITHCHADHLADIISADVFLRWNPEGPIRGMRLAGPAELAGRVAQIDGYKDGPADFSGFSFEVVSARSELNVGPMRITAFPARHLVESYGFRIEGPSEVGDEVASVAYTGDTDSCEAMVDMARGVDLLLSECGFTDDVEARGVHLSGKRAAELAEEAGAGQLVLTHIQPWTDPEILADEAEAVIGSRPGIAKPGRTWTV